MPDPKLKRPINWEDYEYGRSSPRQGSQGSLGSHVQFENSSPVGTPDHLQPPRTNQSQSHAGQTLKHRRSSLPVRINSLAQAGGPNSIENFARSWSHAADFIFVEGPLRQPSFIVSEGADESLGSSRRSGELISPAEPRSLLRQQLEQQGAQSETAVDEEPHPHGDEDVSQDLEIAKPAPGRARRIHGSAQHQVSPYASSYGAIHGSFSSRFNEPSMQHQGDKYREQQIQGRSHGNDKENEPLLVKVVEQEDGKNIQIIIGQSTMPQTVFNSVNLLIGVGLLSLPLGLKYSGWLLGMTFLFLAAIVTRYTAGLLAKCLDVDHSLVSFSDIAWKAFGYQARVGVGLLFTLELVIACVALVVLFGDSLALLIPELGVTAWKLLCALILIPLSFVPLRYLSFTSVLGILCCLGIVVLVFVDGLLKPESPGSLRDPIMASAFPDRWSTLPLSFGLLMSPWGGHSVFPNIYRDMRHPEKYTKAINCTYVFTYFLDVSIAVAGYLMFGQGVHDEVTSNIFLTKGYPRVISVCIVVFIAIIPLTKIPLTARPIFGILEHSLGLDKASLSVHSHTHFPGYARRLVRILIRIFTVLVVIVLAILVPSFDAVMALMGSAMAFSICIVLPIAFYLKLLGGEIGMKERALGWVLMVVCSIMSIIGTVWVFLPKHIRDRLDGIGS